MTVKLRLYLLAVIVMLIAACAPKPSQEAQKTPVETITASHTPQLPAPPSPSPSPTPTPLPAPQAPNTATIEAPDGCVGLSGFLEIQILVGPSDAAGLEPIAVGQLPFTVAGTTSPYQLSGATSLSYQDTLNADWGSYDVRFNADMSLQGTCRSTASGATLEMVVTMDGEQLVTVTSEGFSGEYPWAGTQTREFVIPAENGVTASGEGWAFVLYLK